VQDDGKAEPGYSPLEKQDLQEKKQLRERERVVVLCSVVYRKERDGKESGEYDEKLSLMSQREGKL